MRQPVLANDTRWWMREHVRANLGNGVATHIAFFAIGHTSEHLGEVQFLRGMMGLKGAPL